MASLPTSGGLWREYGVVMASPCVNMTCTCKLLGGCSAACEGGVLDGMLACAHVECSEIYGYTGGIHMWGYMYEYTYMWDVVARGWRERMTLAPRAAEAGWWCGVGPREYTLGAAHTQRKRERERKGATRDPRRISSANSVG